MVKTRKNKTRGGFGRVGARHARHTTPPQIKQAIDFIVKDITEINVGSNNTDHVDKLGQLISSNGSFSKLKIDTNSKYAVNAEFDTALKQKWKAVDAELTDKLNGLNNSDIPSYLEQFNLTMPNLDQNTNNIQTSDLRVAILSKCRDIIVMVKQNVNNVEYQFEIQEVLTSILQLELERKRAVIRQLLKDRHPDENKDKSNFEHFRREVEKVLGIIINHPLPQPIVDVLDISIPIIYHNTFEDVTFYQNNLNAAIVEFVQDTSQVTRTKEQCIQDKEQKYDQLKSLNTNNVRAPKLLKFDLLKGIVLDNLTIQFHVCNEKIDEFLFKKCKEIVVDTRELAWVTWDVPKNLNEHLKKLEKLRTRLKEEFQYFAFMFVNRNINYVGNIFERVLVAEFDAYKKEVEGYDYATLRNKYNRAYDRWFNVGLAQFSININKPEHTPPSLSLYNTVFDMLRSNGFENKLIDDSIDGLLKKELELKVLILQRELSNRRLASNRSLDLEKRATNNLNNPEYIEGNISPLNKLNLLRARVKSRRNRSKPN